MAKKAPTQQVATIPYPMPSRVGEAGQGERAGAGTNHFLDDSSPPAWGRKGGDLARAQSALRRPEMRLMKRTTMAITN